MLLALRSLYEQQGTTTQSVNLNGHGIPSAEAFGSSKLNVTIYPASLASSQAFGTSQLNRKIFATGIPTSETFGAGAQVNVRIYPSGFTQGAFGAAKAVLYLKPSGIASLEAFGASKAGSLIATTGIPSAQAFGIPKIVMYLTPTGIASQQAFGAPQLNLFIKPSGIASQQAFGPVLIRMKIQPSSIASAGAFGTDDRVSLTTLVSPQGITSLEAFGDPDLGESILGVGGIASLEAFGATRIVMPLRPPGIPSREAFGDPKLNLTLYATGKPTDAVFGTLLTSMFIRPTGISSREAFGAQNVTLPQDIEFAGIVSLESFGTPELLQGKLITPGGIYEGGFGTPSINILIRGVGVPSTESFGNQIIQNTSIELLGISSLEFFGLPAVVTSATGIEKLRTVVNGAWKLREQIGNDLGRSKDMRTLVKQVTEVLLINKVTSFLTAQQVYKVNVVAAEVARALEAAEGRGQGGIRSLVLDNSAPTNVVYTDYYHLERAYKIAIEVLKEVA